MKNLLIALALITVSVNSFATSIDKTPVVAIVSGQQENITQIALLADGRLQIKGSDNKITTSKLSKAALNQLVVLTQNLTNVEVKEESHLIVCEMMMAPTLSDLKVVNYNFDKAAFQGAPKLILTADGCTVTHTVIPVEDYAVIAAHSLRSAMIALALNTLQK